MSEIVTKQDGSAFQVSANERVLLAFTHPDDEMSIAAFIWQLQKDGVPLSALWTHSTPAREAETRTSLLKIGVKGDQLRFLAGKDGGIVHEIPRLREEIKSIIDEFKPTRVVTHAFEQGHLDHDATNLLVHLTFDGPTYEVPFYHTYLDRFPVIYRFSTSEDEESRELTDAEVAKKREMLDCYPSQTIKRNVALYDLAIRFGLRKRRLLSTERMRLQTYYNYRSPNHPVETARKIEASDDWHHWLRAVEHVL